MAQHTMRPLLPEVQAFMAAAASCGIPITKDYNGPVQTGVGPTQCSADIAGARRLDAFSVFVEPLVRSGRAPNLHVCTSVFVTKVLFGRGPTGGNAATGVQVEMGGAGTFPLRCRGGGEVVLSSGAIGTPQLLMLSGIGSKTELARHCIKQVADAPGVGQNLMDHGVCPVQLRMRTPRKSTAGNPGIPGIAFFQSATDAARNARVPSPDIQLVLTCGVSADGAPKAAVTAVERSVPGVKSGEDPLMHELYRTAVLKGQQQREAALQGDGATDAASIDTVLNRPQSRGFVALQDGDPHTPPVVDGRWLHHQDDVESQLCGLRRIRDILAAEPLAELVDQVTAPPGFMSADDAALRSYIRHTQSSTWHYSGTARMGALGDAMVVCDPR